MNKELLVNIISELYIKELPNDFIAYNTVLKLKYESANEKMNILPVNNDLENITQYYFSNPTIPEWKYLQMNFLILNQLGALLLLEEHSDDRNILLSVKELKIIKSSIDSLIKIGVSSKLLPNLPFHWKTPYMNATDDIFYNYNILKCTLMALCNFLKVPEFRTLMLPGSLSSILTGLYQISYGPLKTDSIPEKTIEKLLKEKQISISLIQQLNVSIHPTIYIRETMILLQQNTPIWFKKAISRMLTNIIFFSNNGIENISIAMLNGSGNDKTSTWQALDIIFKLILSFKNHPDFKENICQQVVKLLRKTDDNSMIFEQLVVHCIKNFYALDEELIVNLFLMEITKILKNLTLEKLESKTEVCTNDIKKCIRLINAIFVEENTQTPNLNVNIVKPFLNVTFKICLITMNYNEFKSTNLEAKEIILKYFKTYPADLDSLFDTALFGIKTDFLQLRENVFLSVENNNEIVVKFNSKNRKIHIENDFECILELFENDTIFLSKYFKYCLKIVMQKGKYFPIEDMNLTAVFKVLAVLSENKRIQEEVIENPAEIIQFIEDMLKEISQAETHKEKDFESDNFQTLFTLIMVLNALTVNCSASKNRLKFQNIEQFLKKIKLETGNNELERLVDEILKNLNTKGKTVNKSKENKSEFDLILEEIADPLLPIRGHGLLALKKLVDKKDPIAIENKQYILTIFHQHLGNGDSFIYLNAVLGLTSMANLFPDTVLKILCEEFSAFHHHGNGNEIKIKLGEVLMNVIRNLGDMASKYKAILINTFLVGIKDDDSLVRTSSLSNLGELCKVLGYKLGPIIIEILEWVHSIILMDKAIECRRAAVSVIRQLLQGLKTEMLTFLKDSILPIFRTLKDLYKNDKDDIIRLQAQLALEELNENTKNFVFPKPQLHTEKKIIMLN